VEREEDRLPLAALAFATTEGFMLLEALGGNTIITKALKGLWTISLIKAILLICISGFLCYYSLKVRRRANLCLQK
jgi:hypothetical protein